MILFIFDIDGTLTDSVTQHQESYLRALSELGIDKVDTNCGSYKHHTDSWVFAEIFRRNFGRDPDNTEGKDFSMTVTRCFQSIVDARPVGEIPGARAFVELIQSDSDLGFALATGSFRPTAIKKYTQIGLHIPANLLVTGSEFESREEIVLNAISAACTHYEYKEFEQIISIGDGSWDAITARNLGLEFIGVGSGLAADKLKAEGVQNIVANFRASQMADPRSWLGGPQ